MNERDPHEQPERVEDEILAQRDEVSRPDPLAPIPAEMGARFAALAEAGELPSASEVSAWLHYERGKAHYRLRRLAILFQDIDPQKFTELVQEFAWSLEPSMLEVLLPLGLWWQPIEDLTVCPARGEFARAWVAALPPDRQPAALRTLGHRPVDPAGVDHDVCDWAFALGLDAEFGLFGHRRAPPGQTDPALALELLEEAASHPRVDLRARALSFLGRHDEARSVLPRSEHWETRVGVLLRAGLLDSARKTWQPLDSRGPYRQRRWLLVRRSLRLL